jgi:hypothetical protein
MAKEGHFTDGAKFRITLVNQALGMYEKTVQPGGTEGNDPIDITTNDNASLRSFAAPCYAQYTPAQATVTYNAADKAALEAAVNTSDTIRVTYSDDTTEDREGWLRSFVPDSASQGDQPMATITLEFEGEAPA